MNAVCQPRTVSVVLFHGSDESLISEAVSERVRLLVGDGDRSLMVDDYSGDYNMAAAIGAAETPSMFALDEPSGDDKNYRIVVLRAVGERSSDDHQALARYLAQPSDDTHLIIEWGSGRVVKAITDGLKACGGQSIDPSPPSKAKDRREWWEATIAGIGIQFQPAALALIMEWLGEDVARFSGLAETLKSAYGNGPISVAQLQPYLGERGDSKPWDLTDAIEAGDAERALIVLRRLTNAGERHPLQILAQLHNHYARLARLDGAEVNSAADAEAVLGIKGFPAEKALRAYRGLGSSGIRRSYGLLASADVDLRGGTGLDAEVVMDVLVARLARLTKAVTRRR